MSSIFGHVDLHLLNQHWTLLPEKAILWKNASTLLLSDLHLAKDSHFRKHGFAVPPQMSGQTLSRLSTLLDTLKPERLLLLGDLFHSEANSGLDLFSKWRQDFRSLSMVLVAGNHDILDRQWYHDQHLEVHDVLQEGPFTFQHEPQEDAASYQVCGHLHPAVRISGNARQSLRFPCFWIGQHQTVLPSFGEFTGSKTIRFKKADRVVAIAEGELFLVNGGLNSATGLPGSE